MVFAKVVCIDVVPSVGRLPSKIGCHEGGVYQPSNRAVQIIVCRERPVSTFVADNLILYSVSV